MSREKIIQKSPITLIQQHQNEAGMYSLREDGWQKVKKGLTTVEEILRVTKEQ